MNTERPTPETDANELTFDGAEYVSDVVSSDFARKLERERDEAREREAKYMSIAAKLVDQIRVHQHVGIKCDRCKFIREFDALRSEVEG